MVNLAASQTNTRLIINGGLVVGKDSNSDLEARVFGGDSSFLGSVNSKKMLKNYAPL